MVHRFLFFVLLFFLSCPIIAHGNGNSSVRNKVTERKAGRICRAYLGSLILHYADDVIIMKFEH